MDTSEASARCSDPRLNDTKLSFAVTCDCNREISQVLNEDGEEPLQCFTKCGEMGYAYRDKN